MVLGRQGSCLTSIFRYINTISTRVGRFHICPPIGIASPNFFSVIKPLQSKTIFFSVFSVALLNERNFFFTLLDLDTNPFIVFYIFRTLYYVTHPSQHFFLFEHCLPCLRQARRLNM